MTSHWVRHLMHRCSQEEHDFRQWKAEINADRLNARDERIRYGYRAGVTYRWINKF